MSQTSKKMICHFISSLGTGGAERALYNLLRGTCGREFNHQVVCLTGAEPYGPMIEKLGIPVHYLHLKKPSAKTLFKTISALRLNMDIAQGWMYHGNIVACAAARFRIDSSKPKLVWNIRHSLDDLSAESRSTLWAIKANRALSTIPDIIVYNSGVAMGQHADHGFDSTMHRLIPNGFDTEIWAPHSAARSLVRADLKLPDTACAICNIGRYTAAKDHASFLRAIVPVLQNHSNAIAIMAGRDVTYEQPALAAHIPSALRSRIHMLGNRTDIPNLLAACDIFVQTSVTEGFPNVLGEAMASGLAVVATTAGDSQIVMGTTGTSVKPRATADIQIAVESYVQNPQLRKTAGAAGRKRIMEVYPLEQTDTDYISLYRSL